MTNPLRTRAPGWSSRRRARALEWGSRARGRASTLVVAALVGAAACQTSNPPEFDYYEDRIAPVLEVGCALQTTGCHVATEQQAAVGNLDLTSYDMLYKRRDALPALGPYSVGQLLLKGGSAIDVPVQTFDAPAGAAADQRFVAITTDVRHAGGQSLREGSDGYAKLKSWIAQGFERDGALHEEQAESRGDCRRGAGAHRGFDPEAPPADGESYAAFRFGIQPILVKRCAGSQCHGSPNADLYLSCGAGEAESRWNYFAALAHTDLSVSLSEILRRPLSKQRGGTYHEGGTVFMDTDDPDYVMLRGWIEELANRRPEVVLYQPDDEGLRFFGNYVQPMLVKKGCMFQNCHSPAMFHDLRLRGGSRGTFSRIAFDRNYEIARSMLALESENPNDSRIIAKNLYSPDRGGRGVSHRGGPLFEDFRQRSADPSVCAGVDVATQPLDDVPAYCAFVQWHKLERERALAAGDLSQPSELSLIWVSRPTDVGDLRDFDSYRPGADLSRASLTLAADGRPSLGASSSLLSGCGLTRASADVRGPTVSWDGARIAFAARSAAGEPLRIYQANADGSGCARLSGIAADGSQQNGILTHDLDPAYAPDGRLVFASTRGNLQGGYAYEGPQRTPSQLAPNANLYLFDPGARSVRQLTYLLNQELAPSFMADGRLMFTSEKRAPEFFQLAVRRQNLDGGDYHPLFGQRNSVGFEQATEVVELPNRNFALVAAPAGARDGAGTIAIVNRSIGPDQDDRDPGDAFYMHSLSFPVPGAFDGAAGAYRSPAPLPGGYLVVSCDPMARDLKRGGFEFDLCALQPETGESFVLGGEAGRAEIEAVAVYARENRGVFASRLDEPNGTVQVDPGGGEAELHILDLPLLGSLLFQNTRTARPLPPGVGGLDVLESLPPDPSARSFADLPGAQVVDDAYGSVFVSQRELGHVGMQDDGSTRLRVPGGHPLVLRLTDSSGAPLMFQSGAPFTGEMIQREEMQFYPGETSNVSFRRPLFNGLCAGCHGSISGHELDNAVNIDVLTSASATEARFAPAVSVP
jgi:WD40-like Beta Propeller Repeat